MDTFEIVVKDDTSKNTVKRYIDTLNEYDEIVRVHEDEGTHLYVSMPYSYVDSFRRRNDVLSVKGCL